MCKEISIISGYDKDTILTIAVDIFGTCVNSPEIAVEDIGDNYHEVIITGINGKCTCNLIDEEKMKTFDFILKISDKIH